MLKKKNIAMAMAAATVVTAVPAYAAPVAKEVISNTQEQEIKKLKADVLEKFNTKYTKNEALKGNKAGECAYRIEMNGVEYTKYADFEAAFDKEFSKLHNGQKIEVKYYSQAVRVLEDKVTVVDFKDDLYTTTVSDGLGNDTIVVDESYYTGQLGGIVYGREEDKNGYVKIPISNGYITVKEGDTKLNLNAPIFKVVDGNYVDANGGAIKAFNEETVLADAYSVYENGGVIEGYYREKTDIAAESDKGIFAIVKKASASQKENVTVADLYEESTDRLTKKGNELRKVLAATKDRKDAIKDTTLVKEVFGIDKAGEVCELNDANLSEIKIVFSERKNEISEWVPVYEMTITEERKHTFDNVIDHIIGSQDTIVDVAAGLDRYQTSVELSKQGWKNEKTDTVVLVSGANDKLVDGLTATPLAAQKNAPVLLTKKDSIPVDVIAEIERLGAKNVYIVGGESGVSKSVEDLLTKKYSKTVTRIAGNSRYETSKLVAEEIVKNDNRKAINEVFVVGGHGEADALSASAIAGNLETPILLTPADDLSKTAEAFIKANLIDGNEHPDNIDIFVVGGESSVSKKVQSQLANIPGTDFEVKRLSGTDRQETNAAVISEFANRIQEPGVGTTGVVVGKSNNAALVDSLSAGAYAAKTGAHIVLATNELNDSQEDALTKVNGKHSNVVNKRTQAGYGIAEKVAKFIKGL